MNSAHLALDFHVENGRGDQVALIYDSPVTDQKKQFTYSELLDEVALCAGMLIDLGVEKSDRVIIYMPMIPEAAIAMLACARVGAIHSVVFGGFAAPELAVRIEDAKPKVILSASCGIEVTRIIKYKPLIDKAIELSTHKPNCTVVLQREQHKANVDEACKETPSIEKILVCKVTGADVAWDEGRDVWYQDVVDNQPSTCEPEVMDSEDPLFILYTSGSTGTPKGVLHTTAGYLLYAAMTFKYVFDYQDGEVYWCTADVGWITGHSYLLYGPLANGATTLVFEGVPTYPDASRFWQVVDKHKVNIFYTAPTALRALMGAGDQFLETTDRSSLRILGTVGEPINPEAWEWYFHKVGKENCPIVDTWWQTETGGIMIVPLPGATAAKPGSASLPFFGVEPVLLDDEGKVLEGAASGNLAIPRSWPGQMRGVYNNPDRFYSAYFEMYPGYYFTGDGCRRDEDGYYWITGRVDDVINVSGHRMGTAEVESALV
ncbi:UNVERIFIED_CONTAM: hypothetical protein GTU68_063164, partial [Idotea baltica]|nr:hypothetical protein [Idotea baltica]